MFGIWSRCKIALIDHWYVQLDDFEMDTQAFYEAIKQELIKRRIPGLETSMVEFPEGGAFSARRQYLRMRRERLVFDICSAPFGTSWFFSCRFGEIPMRLRLWQIVVGLLVVSSLLGLHWFVFGTLWGSVVFALSFVGSLYLLNNVVAMGLYNLDAVLFKIPVIGAFYEVLLRRDSYFRDDTRRMYCNVVDQVVRSVVENFANSGTTNKVDFQRDLVPTGLGFWGRLREALRIPWQLIKRD